LNGLQLFHQPPERGDRTQSHPGIAVAGPGFVVAQTKPEGEMRFALYVTLAPAWLDPGEAPPGFFSPFWLMYGVHDALVKPMPGNNMAPSLAESWTESEDHRAYEFNLRKGVKFHNGDPFTAEDVEHLHKGYVGLLKLMERIPSHWAWAAEPPHVFRADE